MKYILIAALSVAMAACGGDDKKDKETGKKPTTGAAAGSDGDKAGAPTTSGGGNEVSIPALGLKATAPAGTEVSDMLGDQMLQGPDLVVSIGTPGDFDKTDLAEAVADMKDMYEGVTNVNEETLADGWVFTAENTGSMGTNYWVKSVREIGGKKYKCETTANSKKQQDNAVAACKSLKQ